MFSTLTGIRYSDIEKLTGQKSSTLPEMTISLASDKKDRRFAHYTYSDEAFEILGIRANENEPVFPDLKMGFVQDYSYLEGFFCFYKTICRLASH